MAPCAKAFARKSHCVKWPETDVGATILLYIGKACAAPRRSGFTREEAGPAGQSPPAVHRCCRHRIRG
ncbi:hypothetical protein DK184_26900 [Pseudomonas sp. RW405]|nr:hypothetical protein DK184_26900 [Pseudomonas sp. RW405]